MANTQNQGQLQPEELYDILMENIEPDLTSKNIEKLDALYPNETEEDRFARMGQYELAFLLFDEALHGYAADISDDLAAFEQSMLDVVFPNDGKGDLMNDINNFSAAA